MSELHPFTVFLKHSPAVVLWVDLPAAPGMSLPPVPVARRELETLRKGDLPKEERVDSTVHFIHLDL